MQQELEQRTTKDVVHATLEAFEKFEYKKLDYNFLTLQKVMEQVILCNGDNTFTTPHMSKNKLERAGKLPTTNKVSDECLEHIRNNNL